MAIKVSDLFLNNVFPSSTFPPIHIDKFTNYLSDDEKHIVSKNGKIPKGRKKQNGLTLKNPLIKCFTNLSFPKILRSDNGPAFIAKLVTDYFKIAGVEQQFNSPHNHKSNAFVERFNRVLRAAI
uniref:Integrase catalytic domain-containing protein n=1 Tax=Strongyloides stercoralis TaxID=6248 RepID=A0A0K0EIY2_STRER